MLDLVSVQMYRYRFIYAYVNAMGGKVTLGRDF